MSNLVPDGTYRGRAISYDFKVSGKKESQFIEIKCEITQEGQYKGRNLVCQCWFNTEANGKRAMQTMQYCGWDGDSVDDFKGFGTKDVDLVIVVEEATPKPDGSGEMYSAKNKVAFINELNSSVTGRTMNEVENLKFRATLMNLKGAMNIKKTVDAAAPVVNNSAPPPTPGPGQITDASGKVLF